MTNNTEPAQNFQQLYEDVKKYVALQTEYVKVEFVEKLTILLSTLLIVSLIIVLVIIALFYLFFSLAYALEPLLGSLSISFGIISGIYFILIGILVLFRKRIIVNPLVKFLSNLFLTKN
ncbi:MAG: phage holin family protein [Paludibacter sp.]|nr:phage holin family protein [Paludibacter sp.]